MSESMDNRKQKKQILLVVVLAIGLVIAITTQPDKPASESLRATTSSPRSAPMATVTEVTAPSKVPGERALHEKALGEFETLPAWLTTEELSRIEWPEHQQLTLFRPRPMEAALADHGNLGNEPLWIKAIYGDAKRMARGDSPPQGSSRVTPRANPLPPSPDRRAALIGRAIVRPGEALPDGRTIVEVSHEGVMVSP